MRTLRLGDVEEGRSEWQSTSSQKRLPLLRTRPGVRSSLASQTGRLGYGWADSYNMYVTFDGSNNATVHAGNGSYTTFTNNAGTYSAPGRILATFVKNGDGTYTLTQKDKTQYFFESAGKLIREVDRNSYTTTLSYNGSNQLTTVTEPAGRTLTFSYNGSQLSSVSDSVDAVRVGSIRSS